MKTLLASLLASSFCLAQPPESVVSSNAGAFDSAVLFQSEQFKAQQRVNLYGNLRLEYRGWMFNNGLPYIDVTVSGVTNVTGAGVQTGSMTFSRTLRIWKNMGSYVSQFVQINETVNLYRNGQFVGTGTVGGSIRVAGYIQGQRIDISGSGALTGSGFVQQ
ncbi:MAG: hypothetical protein WC728_14205 [Elusimicrobiota bacterium]